MSLARRPLLQTVVLIGLAFRSILGAPCCLNIELLFQDQPSAVEQSAHAHHQHEHHGDQSDHEGSDHDGHGDHGDSPASNPCCSGCGPSLPPEAASFTTLIASRIVPAAEQIRELRTRPPYPAYEATGPPLLI